jgi:hypothetical protein
MAKRNKPLTDALVKLLSQKYDGDPKGRTGYEILACAIFKEGASGNVAAINLITERLEGKAKEFVELSRSDEDREVLERILTLQRKLKDVGMVQ